MPITLSADEDILPELYVTTKPRPFRQPTVFHQRQHENYHVSREDTRAHRFLHYSILISMAIKMLPYYQAMQKVNNAERL